MKQVLHTPFLGVPIRRLFLQKVRVRWHVLTRLWLHTTCNYSHHLDTQRNSHSYQPDHTSCYRPNHTSGTALVGFHMALVGFQWHLRSEIALVLTHTLPTSGLIAEIKLNSLNTEFFFLYRSLSELSRWFILSCLFWINCIIYIHSYILGTSWTIFYS